jgi:chitosanase
MYYGIFGDTDEDSPQVIGEASWLMANTCFPGDGLNGNAGHTPADVTCTCPEYCPNPEINH